MRRTLYYVIGIGLVFVGWRHFRQIQEAALDGAGVPPRPELAAQPVERPDARARDYRCDGRVYCREMHDCEEATWFLQHCSGVKMDGDGDGIPCEDQFCGH